MKEKIIKTKICKLCNSKFELSLEEIDLYNKLKVENIDICSDCQLKNILAFWPSIWKWYKRKCDFSWETIITNYSNNFDFPVYKSNYFESDKWDVKFLEIDFESSFFQQLKKLQSLVPRPHMLWLNNENCDYCDDARDCKNCYLAISMLECENLFYSYRNIKCNNSSDLVFCFDSDLCYSLINCKKCYKVYYWLNVENSSVSKFLYDCKNVKNCFMCWNLRTKEYCILNKQYTKEEYEKKLWEINFWSRKEIKKLEKHFLEQIQQKALHRANVNINTENVIWNFVYDSKNCMNISLYQNSQNTINSIRWYQDNDCMFSVWLLDSNLCYNVCQWGYLYNVKFSSYCTRCKDSEYLDNCIDCNNCFWCVWLKNKEYCILNKQYSKENYFENVKKIKDKMIKEEEYWRFFPYNMAYSWYNTTLARFYYPEIKENIIKMWWFWEDEQDENNLEDWYDLPDDIKDIPNNLFSKTIICEKTWKPFNYINQIIEFHKNNTIALPKISHIQRLTEMYFPLTFVKPHKWICCITKKEIIHYYWDNLLYKNIASCEAYDKQIYW